MIEIALSIAIIAIGLSSLLVLFPIGINATRAAMEESIAPEMTEFVTNYVRSVFLKQWESEKNSGSCAGRFISGNITQSVIFFERLYIISGIAKKGLKGSSVAVR